MIKKIIHRTIALVAVSALLVSCSEDELWKNPQTGVRDGYIALNFSADIPVMQEVVTRSVDPDGGGVQDMTLFCFDSYGLFISTAKADVTVENPGPENMMGTFKAEVPENTRTIHFLANQNMDEFKEDDFRNKSESEVMAVLEGSSGRMIYWARFACEAGNDGDIAAQMAAKGNAVNLIRNHAKISVDNPENEWIVVTGFAACNTNAFGTVAPYHPQKGFNFTWPSDEDPFVTLPVNDAKMSDIMDVTSNMGQYVFESENSTDDPVSVILRGHLPNRAEEKYYRVLLIDAAGEQLLVRRNHHYKLNIKGELSFGQNTFAEALEAAATNNVWISISDEVNEVEDTDYILAVEKTSVVLGESATENGGSYTLSYTLTGKNGKTITDSDAATVSWIDNGVATQTIEPKFEVEGVVGQGSIQIHLLPLGSNEKLEGTLLLKKGRLQRKIKVITIKQQSFVPAWVASQVYGGMNEDDPTVGRSHVTVMFTIPETCPKELFPMRVLISANDVDIRNESGMQLTVVREGESEEYYGERTDIGYKYLYMVEKAGVQRVYFENILSQTEGAEIPVSIEAEHFAKITKNVTYSDNRYSITVTGLKAYNAVGGGSEGFADDELILYRLVPQKIYAPVQFDLQLLEKRSDEIENGLQGDPFNAGQNDEFLLYSQYLSDYEQAPSGVTFDCNFYPAQADTWWRQNNPDGGRMLMFKPINPDKQTDKGRYSIYMYTNRAKSAEVVRIASNLPNYPAVHSDDAGNDGYYNGNSYRSVTFELANYNPFRFAARINEEGEEPTVTDPTVEVPEVVTPLTWTYKPDQNVKIAFDITSFEGTDEQSVDPFGQEFEIYIDAPMLTLGDNPGLEGKLYETAPRSGRFVYKVDADREQERKYFSDSKALRDDETGVNQTGERKTLNFLTSSIVSAGNIVISSNENKVVYFAKTFSVTNESIKGSLKYKDASGMEQSVPANAFVSFERVRNHSRIGSVAVSADGQYELRLRKEYTFNWYNDEVELHYTASDGKVYHQTCKSLSELFEKPNIVLGLAQEEQP